MKANKFKIWLAIFVIFFIALQIQFAQTEWDEQGEFNTSETPHKLIFSCNGEINATDTLYSDWFNQFGYDDVLTTYKVMASETDSAKISAVLQYSNFEIDDAYLWTNLITLFTDDSTETQNYIADTVIVRPDRLRLMVFGGAANATETDTEFYIKVEAKKE